MERCSEARLVLLTLAHRSHHNMEYSTCLLYTSKFAAPYTYEGSEKAELKGKTFDGIDLSGVGELNTMSAVSYTHL